MTSTNPVFESNSDVQERLLYATKEAYTAPDTDFGREHQSPPAYAGHTFIRGLDYFTAILQSEDMDVSFWGDRYVTIEGNTHAIDPIARKILNMYQNPNIEQFDSNRSKIYAAAVALERAYQKSDEVLYKKEFLSSSGFYNLIFQIFQFLREKIFGTVFPKDQNDENYRAADGGSSNHYWEMKNQLGI